MAAAFCAAAISAGERFAFIGTHAASVSEKRSPIAAARERRIKRMGGPLFVMVINAR
jgi:hypothetical protein